MVDKDYLIDTTEFFNYNENHIPTYSDIYITINKVKNFQKKTRLKMGRRSAGSYVNPTDQASKPFFPRSSSQIFSCFFFLIKPFLFKGKEQRRRELKKNKKQRQVVRESVIKQKDPRQFINELEALDKLGLFVFLFYPIIFHNTSNNA